MNKIIFKIIDSIQYKLSPAYNDINIQEIVNTVSKKRILESTRHKFFSSVDIIETNLEITDCNFYLIPFFYNHAEDISNLANWRNEVCMFLEKYQSLFSKNNVSICLSDPYESSQHFVESVELIAKKSEVNILVITANKKFLNHRKNVDIIYNDTWIEKIDSRNEILRYKPKKLYINLNRVVRFHRCMLMNELIENNLFGSGYNTWGNLGGGINQYIEHNKNTKINKQVFDILDVKDFEKINPNGVIPEKQCIESFLYLNTETRIEHEQLFFSEKTYKPIAIGMPFITLGNPGTLRDLQDRGFITFNDWFDESYDNALELSDRIEIIVKNLKKYSKYNKKELLQVRKEMTEVLKHNLHLYNALHKKNWLKENIARYVEQRKI